MQYTSHARARRNGKSSAYGFDRVPYPDPGPDPAREPWVRGGRRDHLWIDGGIVADPIDITRTDLAAASPADLEALGNGVWLPNVQTATLISPLGQPIVRVSSTPCITTMGA